MQLTNELNPSPPPLPKTSVKMRPPRWMMFSALPIGGISMLAAILLSLGGSKAVEQDGSYAVVQRGILPITVTEGGRLKAVHVENIVSEVEGTARIITLVPENIVITPQDVADGKILIEMDASSLRERLTQQEIQLAAVTSSYTQAKEGYDIQVNQNESDIQAGELRMKFARMDYERYVGAAIAATLTADNVDCGKLIDDTDLGGQALQDKRRNETAIDMADEELKRAKVTCKFDDQLLASGYVSQDTYDGDKLALKQREVALEQAQLALNLFRGFEFPKQVMLLLANLDESTRELERINARARANLARAEAARQNAQSNYVLQKGYTEKLRVQVDKCIIRAKKPGLVTYAKAGRDQRAVEEGADVRERQALIIIPDLSEMACELKIHETRALKVKLDQPCTITLDAIPGKQYEGRVAKVSVLATSLNWPNVNQKVYPTDVSINMKDKDADANLKPEVAAKVEITIARLENVLSVPVQAVFPRDGGQFCYVKDGNDLEARSVKTGMSSESFIQILEPELRPDGSLKSGVKEGEFVLLYAPTPLPPLPAEYDKVAVAEKAPAAATPAAAPTEAAAPADDAKAQKADKADKAGKTEGQPRGDRRRSKEG
jgi:HlyD family secretion protein